MKSTELAIFAAVAKAGGIGRAAAALNTVQSNVTGRIRALEQELGVPLFYRGSRGVTLTRAGERLLPYANQIARLLADAAEAARSVETPCGALRLGSMETTAALRLPPLLASYANDYPKVDIELELGPTEALIFSVLERRIEAAFVAAPIHQSELVAIPVFEEELVIITAARIASRDDALAELAGKREARVLVFKEGCSYRLRLESLLAEHGLAHVRRMEFGTFDGIVGCVEAGMGVSLLPRAVVAPLKKRISIHALPGTTGRAQTLLVHRGDSLLTAAFHRFRDHTTRAFGMRSAREDALA